MKHLHLCAQRFPSLLTLFFWSRPIHFPYCAFVEMDPKARNPPVGFGQSDPRSCIFHSFSLFSSFSFFNSSTFLNNAVITFFSWWLISSSYHSCAVVFFVRWMSVNPVAKLKYIYEEIKWNKKLLLKNSYEL